MTKTASTPQTIAEKTGLFFCDAEFKAVDGDKGLVEGLASTFKEDLAADIIHPGAFTKTLKERVPKGMVKFMDSHGWNCGAVLGTVVKARETDDGLWFQAKLSDAASVQDIKTKMLEGHVQALSIGFRTLKSDYSESVVDGVRKITRHIRELKLYEISPVPFPCNEGAHITQVKGLLQERSIDEILLQAALGNIDTQSVFSAIKSLAAHLDEHSVKTLFASLIPAEEPGAPPAEPPADESALTGQQKSAEIVELDYRLRSLQLSLLGV
jgi:HK97 family phage prohead protease